MNESAEESDLECLSSPAEVSDKTRTQDCSRTEDDFAAV